MEQESASSSSNLNAKVPPKAVYAITERENARSIWTRIGSAWTNRDGSLTLRLDALPVNGVLQVRDPEERRDGNGAAR